MTPVIARESTNTMYATHVPTVYGLYRAIWGNIWETTARVLSQRVPAGPSYACRHTAKVFLARPTHKSGKKIPSDTGGPRKSKTTKDFSRQFNRPRKNPKIKLETLRQEALGRRKRP